MVPSILINFGSEGSGRSRQRLIFLDFVGKQGNLFRRNRHDDSPLNLSQMSPSFLPLSFPDDVEACA